MDSDLDSFFENESDDDQIHSSTASVYNSEMDYDFDDLKISDLTLDHYREGDEVDDGLEIPSDLKNRLGISYPDTPPLTASHTPDITYCMDNYNTKTNIKSNINSINLLCMDKEEPSCKSYNFIPANVPPDPFFQKIHRDNKKTRIDEDLECLDDIPDFEESGSINIELVPVRRTTFANSHMKHSSSMDNISNCNADSLDDISDLDEPAEANTSIEEARTIETLLAKYSENSNDSEFEDLQIKPKLKSKPVDISHQKPPSIPIAPKYNHSTPNYKNIKAKVNTNLKPLLVL
jgi:hypothetical protein